MQEAQQPRLPNEGEKMRKILLFTASVIFLYGRAKPPYENREEDIQADVGRECGSGQLASLSTGKPARKGG